MKGLELTRRRSPHLALDTRKMNRVTVLWGANEVDGRSW
jgi:hypothetical protein